MAGCKERPSDSTPAMSSPFEAETKEREGEMVAGVNTLTDGQGSVVAQETQSQEGSLARETRLPILTDAPPSQQPTVSSKNHQPDFQANKSNESPQQSQELHQYNLHNLLKANPRKTGFAFLSACTGTPDTEEYIEKCTAIDKMKYCLETQLGYVTVVVGENVTKSHFISLFNEFETLILPTCVSRVIFYHFGHGDDETIIVADGYFKRSDIIKCFQSIGSESINVFKIFIFDSCCLVNNCTVEVVEGHKPWIPAGKYPHSMNTLVVCSTASNFKAYYDVKTGCGLMTLCFIKYAPTTNISLRELLVAVRSAVVDFTGQQHLTQMLVYEDKLMGKCNLLAESQGIARVIPTGVNASSSVLSTNIHLTFDGTVEQCVAEFIVEVSSDQFYHNIVSNPIPTNERMATVSGLVPNTEYTARVVAKYKDGVMVKSECCIFTTPPRTLPSDINIMPQYPGSPCARLTWKYSGALSDLDLFEVTMKTYEEQLGHQKVTNDRLGTTVKKLVPLKTHFITVIAVYRDGMRTETSIKHDHADLPSPGELKCVEDYSGSPNAKLTWSFPHPKQDLMHFRVAVEVEGRGRVFEERALKEDNHHQLRNLCALEKHDVSVVAVYRDGDERCCSMEIHHTDRTSPAEVKIIQEVSGSNEADVKWEYPENCIGPVSDFVVRVIKDDDNQETVEEMMVAPSVRQYRISHLQPSTSYTVTVVARYNDELKREAKQEHLNCELQAASIKKVTLTKLRNEESKRVYTIDWSYKNDDPLLDAGSFKVIATRDLATRDPSEGRELPNPFPVTNPNLRSTEIKLEPGVTYSISIETHFANKGLMPQTSKEDMKINTPAENDVKPKIEVPEDNIEQTSATALISEPLILQKGEMHACEGLKLISIEHSVVELPQQDGGDGPNSSNSGRKDQFKGFKKPYSPKSQEESPIQHQSKIIHGLKADTKHLVRLRAKYSTGDCVESDPIHIHTRPYTGSKKCCCCSAFIGFNFFLALILFSSLFLCGLFGVYRIVLDRSTTCSIKYVLTADGVQCGEVNSLHYGMIQVGGNLQQGDTLLGSQQAWVVKKADLAFYSKQQPPITVTANVSEHKHFLLQGWQIYVWSGSVIYGYCCIINNGIGGDVTAKLFMFTSDSDAINFVNGQGAENSVLSDSIKIPPGKQQCFHNWGAGAPFLVSESSYHFIGIDIPGNTTFSYNITVLQKYINGSDYGSPHYFRYDNSTYFSLQGGLFSHNEYVAICKAPLYLSHIISRLVPAYNVKLESNKSLASKVGAESLHISSCKEPHHWMTAFILLGIGLFVFVVFVIMCAVTCFCMYKCKDRLFLPCKTNRRYGDYTRIQNN